jgi:hypothetical protein
MRPHPNVQHLSEHSWGTAAVADRGQQLEVITHGNPVKVTKPLALGECDPGATIEFRPKIETAPKAFGAVLLSAGLPRTGGSERIELCGYSLKSFRL